MDLSTGAIDRLLSSPSWLSSPSTLLRVQVIADGVEKRYNSAKSTDFQNNRAIEIFVIDNNHRVLVRLSPECYETARLIKPFDILELGRIRVLRRQVSRAGSSRGAPGNSHVSTAPTVWTRFLFASAVTLLSADFDDNVNLMIQISPLDPTPIHAGHTSCYRARYCGPQRRYPSWQR